MPHLKAISLMVMAMAAFATSDALIKLLATRLSVGQIMLIGAAGSLIYFRVILWREKTPLFTRSALGTAMVVRTSGEAIGSVGYMLALALSDLSVASAILQSQPLIVTLAAFLFLGEAVGWRRFLAIATGFAGVLVIIRPASDGFEPASLFAVIGALGLTARDLGSRALPKAVSTALAASWALAVLCLIGAVMMFSTTGWVAPTLKEWGLLMVCVVAVTIAYIGITEALRQAPVATVSPFRYTRMVFILGFAYLIFDERPDLWMWVGIAMIIGSGLYAVSRERKLATTDVEAASN